jgi:hypothetical protein
MPLNQQKIGQLVQEQMEALEKNYGDDCEVGAICTIVEVLGPHGSHVRMRSNIERQYVLIGLLRTAELTTLRALDGGDA